MHRKPRPTAALGLLALLLGSATAAQAQLPLDQIALVPDASVAANPVNAPQPFTITTAGSYTVTVTDLATPIPLSAMSVAITTANGPAQIFPLTTQAAATSPYSVTTTATFAAGSYFAQALATANQPGGTFSVVVTPVTPAGSTAVLSYHDVIAAPSTPTVGSAVQAQFTITSSGTYTLASNDFQFPAPLATSTPLTIFVLNDCSNSPSPSCNSSIVLSNLSTVGPSTAALPAGTYDVYAYAQANATALGGLYGMSITGSGTPASAYTATVPVGQLPAGYTFQIPNTGTVNFTLTDLGAGSALPLISPLATLKAIVTQGATALASLTSATGGTPYPITATKTGTAELFVAATPSAATGLGGWAAYLSEGTGANATTLADVAAPVMESGHFGYAFPTPALASGTYSVAVHDFQVPQALAAQNAIAEQQGTAVATATASNPQSVDLNIPGPTVGVVNVLIFVSLEAGSQDDLFGVSVQNLTSGVNAFQATQAVGALFTAIPLTVPAAGNYGVTFTDLGFPAAFASVSLIGTLGNSEVGMITPGGAGQGGLFNITAAGTYTLNVLAQVGANQNYGLYGLTAGVVPTATLTPGAASVGGAQDVTLTWTSTNATSCAASGGWNGTAPVSGSAVNVGPITQTTSYTLICTGPGGPSAAQTVTVDFTASSSSSGASSGSGSKSGGGAFSPGVLLCLSLLAGLNLRRRRAMLPG